MTDLFNSQLILERPIRELWEEATTLQPDADNAIRFWAGPEALVLRGHTGDIFDPDLGVEATLLLAEAHFQKLGQLGGFVIKHAHEATKAADKLGVGLTSAPNVQLALSAVPHVSQLAKLDTVMRPDAEMIAACLQSEVLQPAEKYIAWCAETRPSHMLADIYGPQQYSYHWEAQHIFLHDIDPIVNPVDEDMLESSWQRLEEFSKFIKN